MPMLPAHDLSAELESRKCDGRATERMRSMTSHSETPPLSPINTQTARPRKARRATACERCNQKRIRCDASVIGLPCTGCRNGHAHDCRLLQSKRTRGSAGRFVPPAESMQRPQTLGTIPSQDSTSPTLIGAPSIMPSNRTAHEPEFSLDIEKVHGDDGSAVVTEISGGDAVSAEHSVRPGKTRFLSRRRDSKPAIVGESWFASFLAHNTSRGQSDPHQSVKAGGEDVRSRIGEVASSTVHSTQPSSPTIMPSDLPTPHLRQRMVGSYFSRFHIYFPIIDQPCFLKAVENDSISITLLRCVLFVASSQCDPEIFHLMGYSTRLDAGDDLFSKAKSSFEADTLSSRTTMLQSSFLLHYWWGQPTAFKDSPWWLASAIRSAQCMGMHRSTKSSGMAAATKLQWKRIWWCLYVRDRQVSFALGVPMMINDLDCDVEILEREDFPDESTETADYHIAQASLNRRASSILLCYCSPTQLKSDVEPAKRQQAQHEILTALETWHADLPWKGNKESRHYLTLTLEMCFNFYTINLLQRLQARGGSINSESLETAKILKAAANIIHLVEDAMIYWSPEMFPMMWVTAIYSAMNVQYLASLSKDQQKQDVIIHSLRPSLIALKHFEQYYILARWIRILWTTILDKSSLRKKKHEPRRILSQELGLTVDPPHLGHTNRVAEAVGGSGTLHNTLTGQLYDHNLLMNESEYGSDDRSQISPYPSAEWSEVFSGSGQVVELPSLNMLDSHGLSFLANLGAMGYDPESMQL